MVALFALFAVNVSTIVSAEISFRDTIPLGTAKLYQRGSQGYSLELVFADRSSGKTRFLVNQKELTEPFDDKYTTKDNSTIQILEIEYGNQTQIPYARIYFYGTMNDQLLFDEGKGYRARRVMSAFNYSRLYSQDEMKALGLPTGDADERYVPVEPTAYVTAEQKQVTKAGLEATRSTFSFGWLVDIWAWIKGVL